MSWCSTPSLDPLIDNCRNRLVVLSPVGFIAGNYILLGRLARHLDSAQYLLIPATKITKIFVTSDITTFLIQGAGGGLSTSNTISTAESGAHVSQDLLVLLCQLHVLAEVFPYLHDINLVHTLFQIFLAGLALQMISYFFYTGVYGLFIYRIYTRSPEVWIRSKTIEADGSRVVEYKWWRDWRAFAGALTLSCVGILVSNFSPPSRHIYRKPSVINGVFMYLHNTNIPDSTIDPFRIPNNRALPRLHRSPCNKRTHILRVRPPPALHRHHDLPPLLARSIHRLGSSRPTS